MSRLESKFTSRNIKCCIPTCPIELKVSLGYKFFLFPCANSMTILRQKWLDAIDRRNSDGSQWSPNRFDRICGRHFIGGEPQPFDKFHPDYVPSQYLKYTSKNEYRKNPYPETADWAKLSRYNRALKRARENEDRGNDLSKLKKAISSKTKVTANVSEEDFDDSWTDDFVEVSQSRTCCPTDAEKNEKSFRNIGTNTPFVADVEEVKSVVAATKALNEAARLLMELAKTYSKVEDVAAAAVLAAQMATELTLQNSEFSRRMFEEDLDDDTVYVDWECKRPASENQSLNDNLEMQPETTPQEETFMDTSEVQMQPRTKAPENLPSTDTSFIWSRATPEKRPDILIYTPRSVTPKAETITPDKEQATSQPSKVLQITPQQLKILQSAKPEKRNEIINLIAKSKLSNPTKAYQPPKIDEKTIKAYQIMNSYQNRLLKKEVKSIPNVKVVMKPKPSTMDKESSSEEDTNQTPEKSETAYSSPWKKVKNSPDKDKEMIVIQIQDEEALNAAGNVPFSK